MGALKWYTKLTGGLSQSLAMKQAEASLLNTSSSLAAALGVTKFITIIAIISFTLLSAT